MPPRPGIRTTTSIDAGGPPGSSLLKRSFPPVVDEATRLIVLGSLPGEESLARGQYYANPRNQFWRLMSGVIGIELVPLGYEDRLKALLAAGIGLWDTVASATRPGSLDAAIRNHSPNALPELAARLPRLRAFAFNGGKSAVVGSKALTGTSLDLIRLPSSSPAYTSPFAEKQAAWLRLRDFL
jgi:double-stranded uracil-DNA glycosylase